LSESDAREADNERRERIMKSLLTIAICCLVAAAAPTQDKSEAAKEKIRKKVEAMRKAMRDGKIRKLNVYVRVKLKNGNRLKGVVKNGRFVELHDGIDFVSAVNIDDKRAGMRIWYSVGTTSYVFLRYEQIEHYSIGTKLSDAQVKALEMKLAQELSDTQENYRRMQEARRQRIAAKIKLEEKGEVGKIDDPDAPPDLKVAQLKLLQEFPPIEGWGAEKIARLKLRRITLGVYPNEKERRFEKIFESWKIAATAHEKIIAYKESAEKKKKKAARSAETQESTPPGTGVKPPK